MEDSVKLNILQELIQINTVNGHEQPAAEYLKQVLSDHGIESDRPGSWSYESGC